MRDNRAEVGEVEEVEEVGEAVEVQEGEMVTQKMGNDMRVDH